MPTHVFEVEYAKSSMSTCRVCMAKIIKEHLRVGHVALPDHPSSSSAGELEGGDKRIAKVAESTRWHHFECFPTMKGAKWMTANVPSDASSAHGFDALKSTDKKKLRDMFSMLRAGATDTSAIKKRKAAEEAGGKKKKAKGKKAESPDAALAKLTTVQGVLSKKELQQVQKHEADLSTVTGAHLEHELAANEQKKSGKKTELVTRVAEGRVLGALPKCPKCSKGKISWNRIGGIYSCPGYYEDAVQHRCYFRVKELKRLKWKKMN